MIQHVMNCFRMYGHWRLQPSHSRLGQNGYGIKPILVQLKFSRELKQDNVIHQTMQQLHYTTTNQSQFTAHLPG